MLGRCVGRGKQAVAIPYWQFACAPFKGGETHLEKIFMNPRITAPIVFIVSAAPFQAIAQGTTVYNGQTYTTLSTAAPSYSDPEKGERNGDGKSHHRCGPPPGGSDRGPPPGMEDDGNHPPPPPMDSNDRPLPPPDGCRPPPPPENASGKFEGSNQYPNGRI